MLLRTILPTLGIGCLLAISLTAPILGAEKYTLMAVLAHPDDEVSIAPMLARYANEGHTVILVTVGSGEEGVTRHSKIPAGEELGAARREEARCAARKLGIREPILLAYRQIGSLPTIARFEDRLRELINENKPDVIVTWGPDGLTGHGHHVAIGNVTTRVFQQQALLKHKPRKLYYIAYPESRFPGGRSPFGAVGSGRVEQDQTTPFGTVSDMFISTIIDGAKFLPQARENIACHQTQFDEQGAKVWYDRLAVTLEGNVYLRLVLPASSKKERSVFTGL